MDAVGPDFRALFESAPGACLAVEPGAPFKILAASDAYLTATASRREDLLERDLLAQLPLELVESVSASLERAVRSRARDVMPAQSIDLRRPPQSGGLGWWRITNVPVLRSDGTVGCVIHSIEDVSERKRIEDERELFVSLAENSSDFIGIADPTGKPVWVNPAGRRMVGLALDHPVEKTQIPEYYTPDQRAFATEVIVKEMIEHDRWSGETTFRNFQTDAAIPVSDEHFMIRESATGRVIGMGTITRDISDVRRAATEREQLLARTQDSEERFRLAFDEAPIGMALVALDGRFVRVNRVLCEIVGYEQEELMGLTFHAITHSDDRDADLEFVAQLARAEITRYQLGKRYVRKDGTHVDVALTASILRDRDGAAVYYIAQIEDVSIRKRAEQALQRREKEQRFLAETGSVLVSSLDFDETLESIARLVVANIAELCLIDLVSEHGKVERRMALHADPAKAVACEVLAHAAIDPGDFYLATRVLETGRSAMSNEVKADLDDAIDGERVRLLRTMGLRSMMAVPLVARGELMGVLIAGSSRPGHFDAQDLALAEELGRNAGLAIESARLYQTAQRATRARDDVLAIVAHDLRSPLSSIKLAAQVLEHQLSKHDTARGTKSVENILRSCGRANRLIQDLLDVTRLEAGGLALDRHAVATKQLIFDAVDAQQFLASASSLELRIDVHKALPEIWADHDRLLQVLENLIGNALKFTSAGGSITVRAEPRRGEVLFSIADTGAGIAAANLPHVFDRFWQAKRPERRGAGLGLPICKGIVEAHGGRIWVESKEHRGTTFYFTVPTSPTAGAEVAPEATRH